METVYERRRERFQRLVQDACDVTSTRDVNFVAVLAMQFLRENTSFLFDHMEVFFADTEVTPLESQFVGVLAKPQLLFDGVRVAGVCAHEPGAATDRTFAEGRVDLVGLATERWRCCWSKKNAPKAVGRVLGAESAFTDVDTLLATVVRVSGSCVRYPGGKESEKRKRER